MRMKEEITITEVKSLLKFNVRPVSSPDHYWQYCANCGTKLDSRKCKLICPKCGFYHSCSEP